MMDEVTQFMKEHNLPEDLQEGEGIKTFKRKGNYRRC